MYEPAGQFVHSRAVVVVHSWLLYVPAGQLIQEVHSVAPAALQDVLEQVWQELEAA